MSSITETSQTDLPNDQDQQIIKELIAIVTAERVLQGDTGEAFYTDVYRKMATPLCVVQVETVEQLQAVVYCAHQHQRTINIRGGGASYTDGYIPRDEGGLLIDLSGMNKICEINENDGYVTVEAGTTWATLKETLDKRNLRTPFWGPFSGLRATIGGSMSQNTVSHGSGAHGISAQSAIAMDVIQADGSLLKTGSASAGSAPFLRYFGPDLTGLFTGDCGAFGIKARITLPLIRSRAAHRNISFAFNDFEHMHESMRRIAQERLEDTHLALDGALSQGQIARQERAGDVIKIAMSILNSSPSYIEGFKQLINTALSAKKVIAESPFMTHYIVEGINDAEVKARLHRIRELNKDIGREIPATVPSVVRGMPFADFFNTLGPGGERWVPIHGILPHSKTADFHHALEALYADRSAEMKRLGVWQGGMFAAIGSSGFLYEIALYWPDEVTPYHHEVVPEDYMNSLPKFEANPEAREFLHQLKHDITELFANYGAVNFQVGRAYPYANRLSPETLKLVTDIKTSLDPQGTVSPGNLGLN